MEQNVGISQVVKDLPANAEGTRNAGFLCFLFCFFVFEYDHLIRNEKKDLI